MQETNRENSHIAKDDVRKEKKDNLYGPKPFFDHQLLVYRNRSYLFRFKIIYHFLYVYFHPIFDMNSVE
jgi:hypothetical protein